MPKIYKLDKAQIMGYDFYTNGLFGDVKFKAPEVVKGKSYGFKADTWSFGIIIFYLLTGVYPFHINADPEKSSFHF